VNEPTPVPAIGWWGWVLLALILSLVALVAIRCLRITLRALPILF
jgi:hypothetical protein